MKAGYGRGYYGENQLANRPPRRRRNWFKIVAVLGVGAAAVWLLWPRSPTYDPYGGEEPKPPPPPLPPSPTPVVFQITTPTTLQISEARPPSPPPVVGAFLKQLEDDARSRGFSSVKEYEDLVATMAKELEAAGAKVTLAPHLQHLALRSGSSTS
jgi:hypothetical protein